MEAAGNAPQAGGREAGAGKGGESSDSGRDPLQILTLYLSHSGELVVDCSATGNVMLCRANLSPD